MKKLFYVILFLYGTSVFAQSDIKKLFKDFYYSTEIDSRFCGKNVTRFLKYIKNEGIDLKRLQIVHISAPNSTWGFGKLIALSSRWGKQIDNHFHANYQFHYIALTDQGIVLDFSFNNEPTPLPLKRYLNEMFVAKGPIDLYGETFRINGQGPYYTREISLQNLDNLVLDYFPAK